MGEIPEQTPGISATEPSPPTKKKTPRASRIAEDWTPSPGLLAWARKEAPTVDAKAQIPAFIDYWIAQPGQRGVKNNWEATFRNWLRKAADYAARASPGRDRPNESPSLIPFDPEDH